MSILLSDTLNYRVHKLFLLHTCLIFFYSDTRLSIPTDLEKHKDAFRKLQHVFLCRTFYDWQDILRLAIMWPNLEMLKVRIFGI